MRRFWRGRGSVTAGITLALASFTVVAGGPAASAVTGCSFDAVDTVNVTLDPNEVAILWVDELGDIHLTDLVGTTDCGATNAEADTVSVTGDDAGDEYLQIDESQGGGFSPGLTAEGAGTSEIEINVDLGDGADEVAYVGTSGAEDVEMTATGLDLYDDGDTDITVTDVETVDLVGLGGADVFVANSTPAGVTSKFLFGDGGGDTLMSGSTADYLDGGDGADTMNGGTGNDIMVGGAGVDDIGGNGGVDTLATDTTGTPATEGLNLDLQTGTVTNDGWGNVDTISAFENVAGTAFGDVIRGNSAANTFAGGDGNDRLEGRAGADTLSGGADDDTLNGSYGGDTMLGGTGDDRIVPGTENDTIT
ncbi:MAG TPA: calcium-binding protein, partial [Actinomycetota bacterium]